MKFLLINMLQFLVLASAVLAGRHEWTGVWETYWRNGGAVMSFEQNGDRVAGKYPGFQGTIQGRIEESQLSGTWEDAAGTGTFTFSMSPDGQSFMGRFGTGEWWTGIRTDQNFERELSGQRDLSSPELTLKKFLTAGNRSGVGRNDRLGVVLGLLDFSAFDESISIYDRIDMARMFFQIIDRMTMRVWAIQPGDDAAESGEYSVDLTQSGTGKVFNLRFRRMEEAGTRGTAIWQMVVPPEAEMRLVLDDLLEVHGGEMPHSRQHHELASPRDTMRTFVEQWDPVRKGDTKLFLKTMDLSQVATAVRHEEGMLLGEYLIEVLYRIGLPLRQEIPDYPGRRGHYTHFVHPVGSVEIYPVEQEDGSTIWQFSAETMASARQLFTALEDMPLAEDTVRAESTPFFVLRNQVRSIHRGLLRDTGAGMELWQWVALGLWILLSIIPGFLLTWLIARVFGLRKADEQRVLSPGIRFIWPLRIIFVAGSSLIALRVLGLPQSVDIPLRIVIGVTLSLAGGWLAYNLVDKVSRVLETHSQRYRFRDEVLRSLATSLAKIFVVIGAMLFLAEILSLPYQGVIAGLGIGGLAVALAARSTVENFIGGITLFADKPIEVGDFCRLGDHLGTIESIGLRSVKLRSIERIVVTIPNAEFVNLNIENFTRRDRILMRTCIQLRYETTPDQLRWVLTEIRKLLLKHPMVTPEPSRARFEGFGAHSYDIHIFAYVKTTDFNEFLAAQEDIFLQLIDIVDESGSGFAFPSTVNYLSKDSGVDSERTQRAEAIIRELRKENMLSFPDFDVKTRGELRDTMPYPPEGSVNKKT
jgi:small-conductance mechanosensitive channel